MTVSRSRFGFPSHYQLHKQFLTYILTDSSYQIFSLFLLLQSRVAFTPRWTHHFWKYPTQASEPLYLDRSREYFYTGYMADSGGHYDFKLGLLGDKTAHTQSTFHKARNEIQRLLVRSVIVPNIQVGFFKSIIRKSSVYEHVLLVIIVSAI